MSSAADTHCLVAVVGADPHVKLCDPATGGFTHSLVGHREPVWAASWSLTDQHHLVTGGCDGQVTVIRDIQSVHQHVCGVRVLYIANDVRRADEWVRSGGAVKNEHIEAPQQKAIGLIMLCCMDLPTYAGNSVHLCVRSSFSTSPCRLQCQLQSHDLIPKRIRAALSQTHTHI